jgi:hypothetical protein
VLAVTWPLLTGGSAQAQERPFGTLREQAAVQQEWLRLRLDRVLPRLLREQGVDMWVVPVREYNEDPVFSAFVSPTTMSARRRTIYVLFDRGPERGVERIAIGGSAQGGLWDVVSDPGAAVGNAGARRRAAEPFGPEQWQLLTRVVEARDPRVIAVNISATHAFSDGLSAGEWEQLQQALGPRYLARVVRRELLPLQFIEERLPEMLPIYRRLQEQAHALIATAFSSAVIRPGTTRTEDVVWWLRQRLSDSGLDTWFQPSVTAQRAGVELADSASPVIRRGDVLHVDFGITALGLNTDTQHMGYVLREGESGVPAGLLAAFDRARRLQDIVLAELRPGRSGNEVLARSLAEMRAAGINGTVYSHPVGDHGHGAGPLIGLWDRQEGVAGRGDVPVRANTWFSIELQATTPVPEWNQQPVRMALEEDVHIDAAGRVQWVLRRQGAFHLVR